MNMNTNIGDGLKHRSLIGRILLALLTTVILLSLSALTGWQLGVSFKEKLAMAAFGVLAVLGSHLLLAICQPPSIRVRSVAIVLWLCCRIGNSIYLASSGILNRWAPLFEKRTPRYTTKRDELPKAR